MCRMRQRYAARIRHIGQYVIKSNDGARIVDASSVGIHSAGEVRVNHREDAVAEQIAVRDAGSIEVAANDVATTVNRAGRAASYGVKWRGGKVNQDWRSGPFGQQPGTRVAAGILATAGNVSPLINTVGAIFAYAGRGPIGHLCEGEGWRVAVLGDTREGQKHYRKQTNQLKSHNYSSLNLGFRLCDDAALIFCSCLWVLIQQPTFPPQNCHRGRERFFLRAKTGCFETRRPGVPPMPTDKHETECRVWPGTRSVKGWMLTAV